MSSRAVLGDASIYPEELDIGVKVVAFEPPLCDLKDFQNSLGQKTGGLSLKSLFRCCELLKKLKAIDEIEKLSHEIRPYETNRGNYQETMAGPDMLDAANNEVDVEDACRKGKAFTRVRRPQPQPIKNWNYR